MSETFSRPELTKEEEAKVWRIANAVFGSRGVINKRTLFASLAIENIRMIREINIHREKLGYELLPNYEIPTV